MTKKIFIRRLERIITFPCNLEHLKRNDLMSYLNADSQQKMAGYIIGDAIFFATFERSPSGGLS